MLEEAPDDPQLATFRPALRAGEAASATDALRERGKGRKAASHPGSFQLRVDETPREGITRVARAQLDLTIASIGRGAAGDDGGRAVHDARKALKRLRALLRVSRSTIGTPQYRRENLVLRDVGRALSTTRDSQVLLDTLDALSVRYGEVLRADVWSRPRVSLLAALTDGGKLSAQRSTTIVGVLSDARERVSSWPLPGSGSLQPLAAGFAEVYRRARRAYGAAAAEPTPERLHELRKRAKDLWHAAQLLGAVSPGPMKELQREAHRLSDLLGDDHDLTVLREHVAQRPQLLDDRELELLEALSSHRQRELRGEALASAAGLYRVKPKKLLSRLSLS